VNAVKQRIAKQVAKTMKGIWDSGMTTATGGNISFRDKEQNIWTTPSGVDKGVLCDNDIVCIKPDGSVESERGYKPTSEFSFHRAVYRARPDLNAVIHAHPPALVSFSLAGKIPDTKLIPDIHRLCGKAGFAPYKISGSEDLADRIAEQVKKGHHCIIMENHAAVVAGSTLEEAYQRFEAFETCAKIIIDANRLGNLKSIPKVSDKRMKAGLKKQPSGPLSEMNQSEINIRNQITEFSARACRHHLMLSSTGAISKRLDRNEFIITPDGRDRRFLKATDLIRVANGYEEADKTSGMSGVLHMDIYQRHPEINSIITSCAPYSMAFGLSGTEIDIKTSPEGFVLLREICQLADLNPWINSREVAELISVNTPSVLAENYTLIVTGASVLQAFERLEVTEFTARSLVDALSIGKAKQLSERRLKELKDKFLAG
jgi:L-fuculose-phosphate aldolase